MTTAAEIRAEHVRELRDPRTAPNGGTMIQEAIKALAKRIVDPSGRQHAEPRVWTQTGRSGGARAFVTFAWLTKDVPGPDEVTALLGLLQRLEADLAERMLADQTARDFAASAAREISAASAP